MLLTAFSVAKPTLHAQSLISTINVSTAIDNSGAYLGEGVTDPGWVIADSPDFPGVPVPAVVCPYTPGFWVPTPLPVTNAGWLNATEMLGVQTPGFYTFERDFTVPAGTDLLSLDFRFACDDTLMSLELVPPTGPNIPLSVSFTIPNQYYPSTLPTPSSISSPAAGTWKIQAKVWYIDQLGAFLATGDVKCSSVDCLPDRTLSATVGSQININTGVDASLAMLPFGTVDPRWSIVSTSLPPMSTLDRWNYSPASSVWIGFDNNSGTNETNYQVKFEFCTEACGDYRLDFRFMADNGACVYLDGVSVPSSWWATGTPIPDCNVNPGDQSPFIPTAGYHVDHTTNLAAGMHTLLVDVTNDAGSLSSINVMGGIKYVSLCSPSAVKNHPILNSNLLLFPNPVSGALTVSWDQVQLHTVQVSDVWGRVFMVQSVADGATQQVIPTHELPVGTYILTGQSATGTVVCKRFVKVDAE